MSDFECNVCHKTFVSKMSLEQHGVSRHGQKRKLTASKRKIKWGRIAVGVVVVAVIAGGLFYLVKANQPAGGGKLGKPIDNSIASSIASVSFSTLEAGDHVSTGGLQAVTGAPLTEGGKPEVLYVGADYCPYCASERWPVVVALSKFGTFSNLKYMLSSPNDVFPDTPTLSFTGATYASQYVSFQAVETQDRTGKTIATLTSDQQKLLNTYNPRGGIPFVDIANKYVLGGTQYSPQVLQGKTWDQIAAQLNDPKSDVGRMVGGAAGYLISAICKATNGQPGDVCSQAAAKLTLQ